jgi:hypothetical protein
VDLANNKKYLDAIGLTNSYLKNIDFNNNFINIRFNLLNNYINEWKQFDEFNKTEKFLLTENGNFEKLKDDQRFIQIFFLFYYRMIEKYISNNDFDDSYSMIKDFKNRYKYSETEKLFEIILNSELAALTKDNKFAEIEKKVYQLKLDFPEYNNTILKHEFNSYINKINNILSQKDFVTALKEAKLIYSKYGNDYIIKTLLINCYVQYTIDLYDKKDIDNVIKYSEEGLNIFPDEKTLINNYSSFLKNFINDDLNKKDYKKARILLNFAKEKFPKDSYLNQIDKFLSTNNY